MRLLTCLIFLLSSLCPLLSAEENPVPRFEQTLSAALDLIFLPKYAGKSPEERADLIRTTVEKQFDLTSLIRRTFGKNWNLIDKADQERVTRQVKQLMVSAFVKGMIGKSRPQISFDSPEFLTRKRIEVASSIAVDKHTYQITFHFGRYKSGWQIIDIQAEGISMVANYRQQIDAHFRLPNGNVETFLKKLDDLLNE